MVENTAAATALLKVARERQDTQGARIDGLHVHDIIHCAIPSWLRLHSSEIMGTTGELSQEVALIFLAGQALHALLEHGDEETRVERVMRVGHTLHGTLDMLEFADGLLLPVELKSTRISASAEISVKAPHYIEQLASYCVMRGLPQGRLYVFHMLGDYTETKRPQLRCYDVYFEGDELEKWAEEMERRAAIITGEALPSLTEHHTWECEYCTLWQENGGLCQGGEGERSLKFYRSNLPDIFID